MKLTDAIGPENVKLDMEATDKREAIEELIELMAESCERCDADTILEAVLARERDGSTGLEKGVAIPHAKCDAVARLRIVVGVSHDGVDFESLDGKPSHLFFLLVAPTGESGPHVQAIAKIVKMIKLDRFRERLIKAKRPEDVIETIERVENGEA
ncbi:MAG: PTS sugar transporter subunit IIA [Candidatus Krumholzibacteria bacterium]|nr:PTS sugar transporter subunit IIA [Candidatus Krumholzibacteria bacterium]